METEKKAFGPVVAGKFYPGTAEELRPMVEKFINSAKAVQLPGSLLGIVSPHAGYIYSGPTAGWAFTQLIGKSYELAVVMAPSHRFRSETAGLLDVDFYKTPLGNVKISKDAVAALLKSHFFSSEERLFAVEHSLEVELPFLRAALPDTPIVPVILATHDKDALDGAAGELFKVFKGKRVVFIASSDMSHYQPYDENNRIDDGTFKVMEKMNAAELLDGERTGKVELCGLAPVYVLWRLAELNGGGTMTLLRHENSGDTAGDRSGVVGYGAVAVTVGGKTK